jgi:hypothetical protein
MSMVLVTPFFARASDAHKYKRLSLQQRIYLRMSKMGHAGYHTEMIGDIWAEVLRNIKFKDDHEGLLEDIRKYYQNKRK